ncbi:uncharacterized protein LOC110441422 isoform X5 [Mizuhopecten yessoensis]|uniref:uncharacterized protein LOC110441422 isoform X5 n=1 Tax=Mizuhopecten yessoensis TaxID=6573 RepID=UPI000B45D5BA|nr:uncharacterized protein LOC110441422 isoform X5 [Mizuhopecten yessoensis]
MADESSSSPGYWQQTRLTYSDGTTYLVKLDMPTIQRLENGDTQLLETIRANIESSKLKKNSSATGGALASSSNNYPPSVTGGALASSSNNDPPSVTGGALASSSTEENLPKFWGRRETALLFDLRSTMESDFHSMRTHKEKNK